MQWLLDNKHINVKAYYAPFMREALADWAQRTLYLALDTTTLAGRLVIVRLSVIYRGRAVPLAWLVLAQQSTSVALYEYQSLLEYASTLLPEGAKIVLWGDRGFRSTGLMRLARQLGWHFRLRLPCDTLVYFPGQRQGIRLKQLPLQSGPACFLQGIYLTASRYGPVNIAMAWSPEPGVEPWFIASDESADLDTLADYALRFDVEGVLGREISRLPKCNCGGPLCNRCSE